MQECGALGQLTSNMDQIVARSNKIMREGGGRKIGRKRIASLLRLWLFRLLLLFMSFQGLAKSVFGLSAFFEAILVPSFVLSLGIWMLGSTKTRKGYILLSCLMAVIVAIMASVIVNDSSTDMLYKGIYVYWLVPFTLVLLLDGRRDEDHKRAFTDSLWAILVFNAMVALYRFLIDPTLGGYYTDLSQRLFFFRSGDLSAECIIYGPTAALGAAFLLDSYLDSKQKRYLFSSIFVGFAALSALSRSGAFVLMATIIGLLVYAMKSKRMTVAKFAILATLITIIGFGFLALQPIIVDDAVSEVWNYSDTDDYMTRFSTVSLLFDVYRITDLSDLLFGLGIGFFQPSTIDDLDVRATFVVENFWLTVLGETGLIGFVALGAAYMAAAIGRIGRRSVFRWALWSMIFVNMLAAPLLGVYTQLFTWSMLLVALPNSRPSAR